MEIKQKVLRKHVAKKTTPAQQEIIEEIRKTIESQQKRTVTTMEAKYEYFENQAKYDKRTEHDKAIKASKDSMVAEQIAASVEPELKTERKLLTIAESKLGITMVISKEECEFLGLKLDMLTREGVREVRKKLGLKVKGE